MTDFTRLARIKRQISSGRYETADKLRATASAIVSELCAGEDQITPAREIVHLQERRYENAEYPDLDW